MIHVGRKDIARPTWALLFTTLLPCGMPLSEGDRTLREVIEEIDRMVAGNEKTPDALTPERIDAINAQNEARVEEIFKEKRPVR